MKEKYYFENGNSNICVTEYIPYNSYKDLSYSILVWDKRKRQQFYIQDLCAEAATRTLQTYEIHMSF